MFQLTAKSHSNMHSCLTSASMNPRQVWCFRAEDIVLLRGGHEVRQMMILKHAGLSKITPYTNRIRTNLSENILKQSCGTIFCNNLAQSEIVCKTLDAENANSCIPEHYLRSCPAVKQNTPHTHDIRIDTPAKSFINLTARCCWNHLEDKNRHCVWFDESLIAQLLKDWMGKMRTLAQSCSRGCTGVIVSHRMMEKYLVALDLTLKEPRMWFWR